MRPLLSVVMPVFNQERYVQAAVDSVLRQSFTDFEFVIVDDGSTDGTKEILKRLTDRRVRVVPSPHVGFLGALERGVKESIAPWVARMDSDDLCHPDRFKRQMDFLCANKTCVFLSCIYGLVTPNNKFLAPKKSGQHQFLKKSDITFSTGMFSDPGTVFDRQCALQVGMNDLDFNGCEKSLWYKMLDRGAGVVFGEPLYFARWRLGSISRSNFQQRSEIHYGVRRRYDPENVGQLRPPQQVDDQTGIIKHATRCVDFYLLAGDRSAAREMAAQVWRQWPVNPRAMKLLVMGLTGRRALRPWKNDDEHPDFQPAARPW